MKLPPVVGKAMERATGITRQWKGPSWSCLCLPQPWPCLSCLILCSRKQAGVDWNPLSEQPQGWSWGFFGSPLGIVGRNLGGDQDAFPHISRSVHAFLSKGMAPCQVGPLPILPSLGTLVPPAHPADFLSARAPVVSSIFSDSAPLSSSPLLLPSLCLGSCLKGVYGQQGGRDCQARPGGAWRVLGLHPDLITGVGGRRRDG